MSPAEKIALLEHIDRASRLKKAKKARVVNLPRFEEVCPLPH